MSNIVNVKVEDEVFNSLASSYEVLFEQISVTRFIPHKAFDKYPTNSVAELLTAHKIEIMYFKHEITGKEYTELKETYDKYVEATRTIYNNQCVIDRYYKNEGANRDHLTQRNIEDMESAIATVETELAGYKEALAKYNLPVRFDLNSIIESNDDVECEEYGDNAFEVLCKTVNFYFDRNIHYTSPNLRKNKFSSNTVNEFLTQYKLYLMLKNGEITKELYDKLMDTYCDYLLMCELSDRYNEIQAEKSLKVLSDYGLPIKFDLNKYINSYPTVGQKTKVAQ